MTLDRRRRALGGHGLAYIRIEGSLREVADIRNVQGRLLEDGDELPANDFPLLFGVDHVPQFAEELLPRIDRLHRNVKSVGENCLNLMPFAAAKQAVVDENALE